MTSSPSFPLRKPLAAMSASSPLAHGAVRGTSLTPTPSTLDEAIRAVITSVPVNELAERTGIPAKALYRYATPRENPSDQHRHMTVEALIAVTRETGRLEILELVTAALGFALVKLDVPPVKSGLALLGRVGEITTEVAEVQTASAAAFSDSRISAGERREIAEALYDVSTVCEGARRALLWEAAA